MEDAKVNFILPIVMIVVFLSALCIGLSLLALICLEMISIRADWKYKKEKKKEQNGGKL